MNVWLLITTVYDDDDVAVTAWSSREAAVAAFERDLADDDPMRPERTDAPDGGLVWSSDAWVVELRRAEVR